MIVAVGTRNPAKVNGIRGAFSKYYPDLELRPVDSSSVARAQPRGLNEMAAGATARANFARAGPAGQSRLFGYSPDGGGQTSAT